MGSDRLRVLVAALVALALIVTSTWILDWFTASFGGIFAGQLDYFGLGLRSVTACNTAGECVSITNDNYPGAFATVTLGASTLLAVLVAFQAGSRLVAENASALLTRIGCAAGALAVACAFATAFFFGPDTGDHFGTFGGQGIAVSVERTWAPHLAMLGALVGCYALYAAAHLDSHASAITDPRALVLPNARALSVPIPTGAADRPSAPVEAPPASLRLRFVMATAEITRAGIDARREDGSTVLVLWRDVVGVVVRRLPDELEAHPFADLVSTTGSTLRLVPWTRLSGDPLDGSDRTRAFAALVIARCPDVKVDRATREFLDNHAPPAQLPDPGVLAAHDAKLA